MKILITGMYGQLVTDIIKQLNYTDHDIFAFDRNGLDVADHENLKKTFDLVEPDIFIQGASYHVVEDIENNIDKAVKVNISSLHTIAKLCQENDCLLINFSTNYVFDGDHYSEDCGINENVIPNPLNIYGITKYAGEQVVEKYCEKHINFRVAGLFGITGSRAKKGTNFPINIIKEIKEQKIIKAVSDQLMNITYTLDAAKAIVDIINRYSENKKVIDNFSKDKKIRIVENGKSFKYGTYHLTNTGMLTWYDLAKFICDYYNYHKIEAIENKNFYSNIKRPKFSALDCSKIQENFGITLQTWQSGIIRFINEYKNKVNPKDKVDFIFPTNFSVSANTSASYYNKDDYPPSTKFSISDDC